MRSLIIVFVAFFVVALAVYSSAQVYGFGPCPDVHPVDDFDADRYAGQWYEIARFYDSVEKGLKCVAMDYTVMDGYLLSNSTGMDTEDRVYSHVVKIYNVSTWNIGIFYYDSDSPSTYWLTFVDYHRYSINYFCEEFLGRRINVQYVWIFARDRAMSKRDYDDALLRLNSMGIDTTKLKKSEQRNCPDDQSLSWDVYHIILIKLLEAYL
nr:apolipoprotein D-like [Lytechinus pictus]